MSALPNQWIKIRSYSFRVAVQNNSIGVDKGVSHLTAMYAAKGGGVHPLKGIVSWVQNVVKQFV